MAMGEKGSASRVYLWSLVPALIVLGGGLTYLLNVFGLWRHNLLIYLMLLVLVAAIYALSVAVGLGWRRLRG
jgi:hypothetical protein